MDAVEEVFGEKTFDEYKDLFSLVTRTLASDEFGGRFPNTTGEKKTLEYMQEKFKEIGLLPGNPSKNSYFQEVPLVQVTSKVENDEAFVKLQTSQIAWKNQDDFVAISWRLTDRIEVASSQLVWAGYGIVAPEYNWNDYKGLDVKGKTVIVMINDPGYQAKDSTFFKGKELTYYGRWTYKYEEAARQGADAIIIIHETAPAAYPWSVVVNSRKGSQLHAVPSDGTYSDRCAVEAWATEKTARELFHSLNLDYDILTKKAATKEHSSFYLDAYFSLTIKNSFEKFTSNNVVALLPGSERPDEIVIFSAHWDHFGTKGSDIYRGALDNASGCAGLYVIASAFQKLKKKPARSILFFSSTAEEQGLTGAEYYVENPIFPLSKTVGILNMDMMNVFGRMRDVCFYGWGNSELDKFAEQAAREEGRYISRELKPEDGLFFRSDHYCFCKKKVPGMFLAWSSDVIGQNREDVVKKMEQFTMERYHKPTDAFNPNGEWHLDGTMWDFRYLFRFGFNLALSTDFPKMY